MKRCTKCKQEKGVDQFSEDKRSDDGLRYKCKECDKQYYKNNVERIKEYSEQYRQDNSEQRRQYDRQYYQKNAKRRREYKKQHYRENVEYRKKYNKQHYQENPEKIKAKSAVRDAIRKGDIPHISNQKCTYCGQQANEYHHWSYREENWLTVIPLCYSCHRLEHVKLNMMEQR